MSKLPTDAVQQFINRQPGDANHAAVRANLLKAVKWRCLDATSPEANDLACQKVVDAYRGPTHYCADVSWAHHKLSEALRT